MRRRVALLALAMLAACESAGTEAEGPAGTLAGRVEVGPFCPVEVEGEECPPPPGTLESIQVLVYAGDRLVATTNPDADGRFELRLPAGTYRVALEHEIGLPGAPRAEREARVEADGTTTIAFEVDTGIR